MRMRTYIIVISVLNVLLLAGLVFIPAGVEKTHAKVQFIIDYYAKEEPTDHKILILGDSTVAFGVRPQTISESALSLALPGSTMLTVKHELSRYLKRHAPPRCLIMAISSIDAYYDQYFWSVYVANQLYGPAEIEDIYQASVAADVFPAKFYSKSYYDLKAFFFRTIFPSPRNWWKWARTLGLRSETGRRIRTFQNHMREAKGFIAFESNPAPEFINNRNAYLLEDFKPNPSDDFYFSQILNLTKEKGIQLIYVEMPMLMDLNPKVREFNVAHINHVENQITPFAHAKLLRFTSELPRTSYRDVTHLHQDGAELFSQNLRQRLGDQCN